MNAEESRSWSLLRKHHYRYFEEQLSRFSTSLTLYDLGAGPLQFGSIFKRFDYVGVDFKEYGEHITIVADLTEPFPIASGIADIVTLSNVIEHIPDAEFFFTETNRIMRHGGTVVGTVPFLVQIHQAPHDYARYTIYQLERLLAKAGFSDISVVPLGNLIDTYNTLELKFFDQIPGWKLLRLLRRIEMRVMHRFLGAIPSHSGYTESYGFTAHKP